MIGNKIADKITLLGKSKEKTKKVEEIYILGEKRQQIIDDLKLIWMFKNGISNKCEFAWHASDDKDLPISVTKKWI